MFVSVYAVFWAFIKAGTLIPQGGFWFNGSDAETELVEFGRELVTLELAGMTTRQGMIELKVSETFIESGGKTA